MRQKGSGKRTTLIVLLILLLACAAASAYILKWSRSADAGDAETAKESIEAATESVEEAAVTAKPGSVIFAVSDYQADPSFDDPADTLRMLVRAVRADGREPDAAVFCGDYTNDAKLHDYQLSPEDSITEIKGIMDEEAPSAEDLLFVQGNHDALTESISKSGLHEYDDYLVYVLNTQEDFPWKQGVTSGCRKKVEKAAADMKTCFDSLIAEGETRPVVIAGHVPLHYSARTSPKHTTGDNLYSSLIFDVVNDAASELDVIYLYGHNHSKGWDCYMGGSCVYKAPGDSILLPEFDDTRVTTDTFTEQTLNFTYMNAGYTGYYMNCGPGQYSSDPDSVYRAADETLSCSVIEIYGDRIEITRYDKDGRHVLGAAGEADPYKGGIDTGLIGSEYYSTPAEGPAVIERKAVKLQNELRDAA